MLHTRYSISNGKSPMASLAIPFVKVPFQYIPRGVAPRPPDELPAVHPMYRMAAAPATDPLLLQGGDVAGVQAQFLRF